jgi:hypothetical protein
MEQPRFNVLEKWLYPEDEEAGDRKFISIVELFDKLPGLEFWIWN